MKKNILKFIAITLTGSLLLSACGGNTSKPESAPATSSSSEANTEPKQETNNPAKTRDGAENTLVVGAPAPVQGRFMPIFYTSAYDGWVAGLVTEGLVDTDKDGMPQVSRLVEDYSASEDYKTHTFKLKEGITFSDGTPLTTADIKFTFELMCDPEYPGRYVAAVEDLAGYKEYKEGDATEISGIKVIDDRSIEVTFAKSARTNFTNFSVDSGFGIMQKAQFPDYKKGNITETVSPFENSPIGSGPYIIDILEPEQYVQLTKNTNYWYKDAQYDIENIVIKESKDSVDIDELLTGQVDMLAGQIDKIKVDRATNEGKDFVTLDQYDRNGYGYVTFNTESDLLKDPVVRQALVYGFDGETFIDSQFGDLANRLFIPLPKVVWAYTDEFYNSLTHYTYDLEKAKSLLEEAGWKDTNGDGTIDKDGKEFVLRFMGMPEHSIIEPLIPLMTDNYNLLGIKLETTYNDFNALMDLVRQDANVGKWDMYFMAGSLNVADPEGYASDFKIDQIGDNLENTSRYRNQEVNDLILKADDEIDIDKATKLYQDAYRIVNRDQPKMHLYSNIYTDMINNRVKGMDVDTFLQWDVAVYNGGVSLEK